jgi:hypothetical protein
MAASLSTYDNVVVLHRQGPGLDTAKDTAQEAMGTAQEAYI